MSSSYEGERRGMRAFEIYHEKKCKKTSTYYEGDERVFPVRFYCIYMRSILSFSFNMADIFESPTKGTKYFTCIQWH